MNIYDKKIAALLHDPPNKAWNIHNHKAQAKKLALGLFGEEIARLLENEDILLSDRISAAIDRWILTKTNIDENKEGEEVGTYQRGKWLTPQITLYNPFSIQTIFKQDQSIDKYDYEKFISNVSRIMESIKYKNLDKRQIYHIFYSLLEYEWLKINPNSPADTRIPIHTIFDHNYACATAINLVKNKRVRGFLVSVKIGNIQSFIKNSRKLEHFWFSSWFVSAIAWYLVSPFVMEFGPDVLILPTARSNPFYYSSIISELGLDILNNAAKDLGGYIHDNNAFPNNAVMPAHITMLLPSADHYKTEVESFESKYNRYPRTESEMIKYLENRFKQAWIFAIESVIDMVKERYHNDSDKHTIENSMTQLGVYDNPPLTIDVQVAEFNETINADHNFQYLSGIYSNKMDQLFEQSRNKKIKISPFIKLNLTAYTKNKDYRICTLCGDLPCIIDNSKRSGGKKGRETGQLCGDLPCIIDNSMLDDIDKNERLCPYCFIKYFATKDRSFESIVNKLFNKKSNKKPFSPPKFPSLSSISSFSFREQLLERKEAGKPSIPPISLDWDKNKNISIYLADRKLQSRCNNDFFTYMFLNQNPEQTIYGSIENRKYWKDNGIDPNVTTYYALVKGDGDDIGKILSGKIFESQLFCSYTNIPKNIYEYFSRLTPNSDLQTKLKEISKSVMKKDNTEVYYQKEENERNIDLTKIPASITYHATISRALMNYAVNAVNLIEENNGLVIYAGGDDIVCLLPVEKALDVVSKLRRLYRGFDGMEGFYNLIHNTRPSFFSMGDLGQSFSLVFAHHKFPLSYAIDVLNSTEEQAKEQNFLQGSNTGKIRKLNSTEEQAKEQNWLNVSKNNIAISYLARSSHDLTVFLPLNREGLEMTYLIDLLGHILKELDKNKYSKSLISDLFDWADKIELIGPSEHELIHKIVNYITVRNMNKTNGNNNAIYDLDAKISECMIKIGNFKSNPEVIKINYDNFDINNINSIIKSFIWALKIINSPMREIE